jgi:hypothetical protein
MIFLRAKVLESVRVENSHFVCLPEPTLTSFPDAIRPLLRMRAANGRLMTKDECCCDGDTKIGPAKATSALDHRLRDDPA